MSDIETEMQFKIFDNPNSASLTVGRDPDGLCLVHIDGREHFGGELMFSAEFAKHVANAIMKIAKDIEDTANA